MNGTRHVRDELLRSFRNRMTYATPLVLPLVPYYDVASAALLRATVTVDRSSATDSLLLESVLIAAESIITYRRRYRSHAQLETLLDLLVTDADNPRSLAYQVELLTGDLRLIRKLDSGPNLSEPERLVLEASTALRLADTALLAASREDGTRPELDGFLALLLELFARTADAIDGDCFVHLPPLHSQLATS